MADEAIFKDAEGARWKDTEDAQWRSYLGTPVYAFTAKHIAYRFIGETGESE